MFIKNLKKYGLLNYIKLRKEKQDLAGNVFNGTRQIKPKDSKYLAKI